MKLIFSWFQTNAKAKNHNPLIWLNHSRCSFHFKKDWDPSTKMKKRKILYNSRLIPKLSSPFWKIVEIFENFWFSNQFQKVSGTRVTVTLTVIVKKKFGMNLDYENSCLFIFLNHLYDLGRILKVQGKRSSFIATKHRHRHHPDRIKTYKL